MTSQSPPSYSIYFSCTNDDVTFMKDYVMVSKTTNADF